MRSIYKVAGQSAPTISTGLLDGLFNYLKDDTLAFLAGIWTSVEPNSANDQLHVKALRHATAFLKAYQNVPSRLDFQVVSPSIIAALQNLDLPARETALECLDILADFSYARPSSVYGFDTIYGDSSGMLHLCGVAACLHSALYQECYNIWIGRITKNICWL
jgi:U3 small nucleolar RNA-associated protein 10